MIPKSQAHRQMMLRLAPKVSYRLGTDMTSPDVILQFNGPFAYFRVWKCDVGIGERIYTFLADVIAGEQVGDTFNREITQQLPTMKIRKLSELPSPQQLAAKRILKPFKDYTDGKRVPTVFNPRAVNPKNIQKFVSTYEDVGNMVGTILEYMIIGYDLAGNPSDTIFMDAVMNPETGT